MISFSFGTEIATLIGWFMIVRKGFGNYSFVKWFWAKGNPSVFCMCLLYWRGNEKQKKKQLLGGRWLACYFELWSVIVSLKWMGGPPLSHWIPKFMRWCQELKVEMILRGKRFEKGSRSVRSGHIASVWSNIVVLNFIRIALALFILNVRYLWLGMRFW